MDITGVGFAFATNEKSRNKSSSSAIVERLMSLPPPMYTVFLALTELPDAASEGLDFFKESLSAVIL